MATRRPIKHHRTTPVHWPSEKKVPDEPSGPAADPVMSEIPPPKRHRTQRVVAETAGSRLAAVHRLMSSNLDLFPAHLDHHLPPFEAALPPSSDFYQVSGLVHFPGMTGASDMAAGVPRVASSAHINELVAKYSQPSFEHDLWPSRSGYAPNGPETLSLYGGYEVPTGDFHQGKMSEVSDLAQQDGLDQLSGSLDVQLLPVDGSPSLELLGPGSLVDGDAQSMQAGGSYFEDLASMAAQAEIGSQEAELLVAPGASAGEEPVVVEGLEMEDETREAVAKWLMDSPGASNGVSGVSALPDVLVEEEERSLPQWVLEELGESDTSKEHDAFQRLVRADSNGSSTNAPSFGLKGDSWEMDVSQEAGADLAWLEEAQSGKQSFVNDVPGVLQLDDPEGSTHSSPGEEADEACSSPDEAAMHMSRSFSTTWMKDLLEEGDTFIEDLGTLQSVFGGPGDKSFEVPDTLGSTWLQDSTVAM